MKIEIAHSDGTEGESNILGRDDVTRQAIEVNAAACSSGTLHVGRYCLDENHAAALVLALQAAIAEVQARAVSR